MSVHGFRRLLVPSAQQEHEQHSTDQNGECAYGRDNDLSHHLHVAGQRVCKTHLYPSKPCSDHTHSAGS